MRAIWRAIGDALAFIGRTLKALFNLLWGFMVIFSFIVNIVLIVVVAVLGILIFNIKNDVADPLLKGLHSSFVGLDEATIDWTIPVRDSVDATFDLPLEQNTIVTLTDDVPLRVQADISGPVAISNATVALTLPAGTDLPVALNLLVPVDEEIDVNLDVRAVIPLSETQLHDPFDNLRLTFEPIILALDNLPNNFGEAITDGTATVAGNPPALFDPQGSIYIQDPWPGFSLTAGLNYPLLADSQALNTPVSPLQAQSANGASGSNVVVTGIVPQGGIPALDAQVRAELYTGENASPSITTQQAIEQLEALGIPRETFTGEFSQTEADEVSVNGTSELSTSDESQSFDAQAAGGPNTDEPATVITEEPQPAFTPPGE